jgi:hypothetical protein
MRAMVEPKPAGSRGALNAPPTGNDRIVALIGLAAWMALMIAIPLRYYVGSDLYDERFSWRMFSAVRVQQCSLDAREVVSGHERPIALMEVLPAPWVSLLERNRPAVLRRFLTWRCASDARPSEVRLTHTCQDASGDPLPPIHRVIDCETRAIEETGGEGAR